MKNLDAFKALDRLFVGLLGLTLAAAFVTFSKADASAASELKRNEDACGDYLVSTSSTSATVVNSTNNMIPINMNWYNMVCWANMGTDNTKFVYISTYSHVDESLAAYPSRGATSECQDWTHNIPIYVWHADTEDAVDMRFRFCR